MSEPFLAEIRIVGFTFAPRGWAACDGQLIQISQNQSLYSLLGTTYGGDGETTFALPDLRGRTPIHAGSSNGGPQHSLGSRAGRETVALAATEMPQHSHTLRGSASEGNAPIPAGNVLADTAGQIYRSSTNLLPLRPGTVVETGGGLAHENMQPYLALNFVIAIRGLFPSRS